MRIYKQKQIDAVISNYDAIVNFIAETDAEMRPYQIDIYFYPETGDLYQFTNPGGNSWLDDDHITICSINNEYLTAEQMDDYPEWCRENIDTYRSDLDARIDGWRQDVAEYENGVMY